jgi:hypothetical protein
MKFLKLILAFAALFTVFGRRHRSNRRNRDQFEDDFNKMFRENSKSTTLDEFKTFIKNNSTNEVLGKCPNPNEAFFSILINLKNDDASKSPLVLFTEVVDDNKQKDNYCSDVQASGSDSGQAPKRRRRKYFY